MRELHAFVIWIGVQFEARSGGGRDENCAQEIAALDSEKRAKAETRKKKPET